jgi:hypothetical protein
VFCLAPIPAKPSFLGLAERPPKDPPLLPPPFPPGVGSGRLALVGDGGALTGDDSTPILVGELGCEAVCASARPPRVGDALEIEDDVGVTPIGVLTGGNERCAPGEGRGRR